jgi:hypothetical protein
VFGIQWPFVRWLGLGKLVWRKLQVSYKGRNLTFRARLIFRVWRVCRHGQGPQAGPFRDVVDLRHEHRAYRIREPRCLHRSPLLPAWKSPRKTLTKNGPVSWSARIDRSGATTLAYGYDGLNSLFAKFPQLRFKSEQVTVAFGSRPCLHEMKRLVTSCA